MKFYETWLIFSTSNGARVSCVSSITGFAKDVLFFCGGVLGITLEKGLNMMDLFSSTGLLGRLRGGIHRKPRSSFEAVLFCVEFVHPNAAVRSI